MVGERSTIVIIEPRQFLRDCFSRCLSVPSLDHDVATFASVEQWDLSSVGHVDGDVVVMYDDSRRHDRGVVSDAEALAARIGPSFSLVLVSDNDDPAAVVALIESGLKGYIPTSVSLKVAIEALRLVWAGGVFVPANCLLRQSADRDAPPEAKGQFTPRQNAVLEHLKKGKANKIIAFELQMKESTVKVHVRNVMRRVGASNRTEVAVTASGIEEIRAPRALVP